MGHVALHAHNDEPAGDVYRAILWELREAGIPHLVGGTYALEHHADLVRDTKDVDLFVRRADWTRITDALALVGVTCELAFSHWLGKARCGERFVDLIFAGGNGFVEVDDEWLAHGVPSIVLEIPVHLVAAEEMIWSKSFVMERERFDGGDVAHILRKSGAHLDWERLLRRFADHAPVLLSHLLMFRFAYPGHRDVIPNEVMEELWTRAQQSESLPARLCRGTLVSREQYLVDIREWGYLDAREMPLGRMTPQQIDAWTSAIAADK